MVIFELLKKLKIYLIGIGIIIILLIIVNSLAKRIGSLKSDNARIENNNFQLMGDARNYENYYLKEKEVTGKLKRERDSLAKGLSVKPRQIEKLIVIDNSTHDTIPVPVPVTNLYKNVWMLKDSTACLKYASKLVLEGDSLKAERQLLEWNNKTIGVYYRDAKFLWFIRISKFKNYVRFNSTCGKSEVQEFSFIK